MHLIGDVAHLFQQMQEEPLNFAGGACYPSAPNAVCPALRWILPNTRRLVCMSVTLFRYFRAGNRSAVARAYRFAPIHA